MKKNKKGMEMVQVALLIGIAETDMVSDILNICLVFRERIMDFIDSIFDGLANSGF